MLDPRLWRARLALALGVSLLLHALAVTLLRFDARAVPSPARLTAWLEHVGPPDVTGRAAGVVSTEPDLPVARVAPPPVPVQPSTEAPAPGAPMPLPETPARHVESPVAGTPGTAETPASAPPAPRLPEYVPLRERPAYWLGARMVSSAEPSWIAEREVDGYRLEEWLAQDKVTKPVARLRAAPIVDPRRERMARVRALVELLALIDESGRVVEVAVLDHAPPRDLIDAAIEAVRKSGYRAAELEGRPVKSRVYLRIRYDME